MLKGQNALFADVSAHIQLPSFVIDSALTQSRTSFLLRAVTAAVATITHHEGVSSQQRSKLCQSVVDNTEVEIVDAAFPVQ